MQHYKNPSVLVLVLVDSSSMNSLHHCWTFTELRPFFLIQETINDVKCISDANNIQATLLMGNSFVRSSNHFILLGLDYKEENETISSTPLWFKRCIRNYLWLLVRHHVAATKAFPPARQVWGPGNGKLRSVIKPLFCSHVCAKAWATAAFNWIWLKRAGMRRLAAALYEGEERIKEGRRGERRLACYCIIPSAINSLCPEAEWIHHSAGPQAKRRRRLPIRLFFARTVNAEKV